MEPARRRPEHRPALVPARVAADAKSSLRHQTAPGLLDRGCFFLPLNKTGTLEYDACGKSPEDKY